MASTRSRRHHRRSASALGDSVGARTARERAQFEPPPARPTEDVLAIDLLHPEPVAEFDLGRLVELVDLGFAGIGCHDEMVRLSGGATFPGSTWDTKAYAADLFLERLVETAFRHQVGGWEAPINSDYLRAVFGTALSDHQTIAHRQAILKELAEPAHRADLEKLYLSLCRLRGCFAFQSAYNSFEATQNRRETLTILRDVLVAAESCFAGCQSALRQVPEMAKAVMDSQPYQALATLLEYTESRATVDARVTMAADGSARSLAIINIEERHLWRQTLPGRLWSRFRLWLSGVSLSEAPLMETWLSQVFDGMRQHVAALLRLRLHFDVYLAMLSFKDRCEKDGLAVCFPEFNQDGRRELRGVFNPLLYAQDTVPVPCDLKSSAATPITVITGPNSGGKTRLLQALAFVQLLGQAGFYVPAERAELPMRAGLFVSIGELVQADQTEGRLGAEMIRVRRVFETAPMKSLVLLDELCSGTNPAEGEEIFELVIDLLPELELEVFLSTHFLGLAGKLHASGSAKLQFIQVVLDDQQDPTYGFAPGVAATSLAAKTAARIGVNRPELVRLVKQRKELAAAGPK